MKKVVPLLLATSLAACGGGGGSTNTESTPESNLLAINADNAELLARSIYNVFDAIGSIESILQGVQLPDTGVDEIACDQGSITLTTDLGADNIPNAAGEYIQGVFNNCVYEDTAEVLNGTAKLTIDYWVSDQNLALDLDFDLDYQYADEFETASGTMGIALTGSAVEITTSMDFYSTKFDGSVQISTGIPILYEVGDFYPTSGELTADGANGSYLTLNADTGDNDTVYYYVSDGANYTESDEIDWITLDSDY